MTPSAVMTLPLAFLTACATQSSPSQVPVPAWSVSVGSPEADASDNSGAATPADDYYVTVADNAAVKLGCSATANSPICAVAPPSAEEDSAFRAEGLRLMSHPEARCRRLGEAIAAHETDVRMYRKAVVRRSGPLRLYGVGHTYEIDDVWLVRVARRIDDVNERSIEEKKRTLRHEMSHTIGATEMPGIEWSAEDYATRCG